MLEQWIHLLGQIVDNPMQPLEQFSMVPPAAKTHPAESRRTARRPLAGSDSFVARAPGRRAAEQGSGRRRARQLDLSRPRSIKQSTGAPLDGRRHQAEDVVAMYAHRDASLVLALLGILKAGAVFVILDPAYPPARLIDYLRVARPSGLLHMEEAGPLPAEIESDFGSFDDFCSD